MTSETVWSGYSRPPRKLLNAAELRESLGKRRQTVGDLVEQVGAIDHLERRLRQAKQNDLRGRLAELNQRLKPKKVKRRQKPVRRKKTINERMIELLDRHPTRIDWSLQDWGEELQCTPSAVQKTECWKTILKVREECRRRRQEVHEEAENARNR